MRHQIHISDHDITTPVMRRTFSSRWTGGTESRTRQDRTGATVIINTDAFEDRNLAKAGYDTNPLEDDMAGYTVIKLR